MLDIPKLKALFSREKESIFNDFFTFLRFKTIATDPSYNEEIEACAAWLADYLKKSGLKVETWNTEGAPTLFATDLRAGPEKETLLFYCHYDVQPVDPLDAWISPPFEPIIRDGEIYARGAVDNKGQCFYTIIAIRTLLQQLKSLPINLKLIIEGEEESGSAGLAKLLQEKKDSLSADYLLIVDSGIEKMDEPAISLGARGLVTLEVTLQESNVDLHSGMCGGIAYNPLRALSEMLAKLHNEKGSVAIPGFYDDIIPLSTEEKNSLSLAFDHSQFSSRFGFKPAGMEIGFSPNESAWLRPTLEINGLWGGYNGPGFKTVIPALAKAKISCRLVPDQDPNQIAERVRTSLIELAPRGMKLKVEIFPGMGAGFRTSPLSHLAHIMQESYSQVFDKPCKNILMGGTIPIAVDLASASGAEMVLVGLCLPGDQVHAPNEHFGIDRFEYGYLTICRAIELFGVER